MSGIPLFRSYNSTINHKKWIVNLGSNKHMDSSEPLLPDTIDVSELNLLVNHLNGSFSKINKIGNLQFSENLTLSDVFLVHNFKVNLLFVHKLCNDRNYEVVFNEYNYKNQTLQSKKVVENGRVWGIVLSGCFSLRY